MTSWIYLSYTINQKTPLYGGQKTIKIKKDKRIENGDSCNSMKWAMSNHTGTHIDFPRHFSKNGGTIDDYQADFWVIENIGLIEIRNVKPAQILCPDDFNISSISKNTQLLLVKTGFSELRNDNIYWEKNPGIHPDVADFLRDQLPALKIVGFDTISISSYANRNLGRISHKAFLDNPNPILLLEDMSLGKVNKKLKLKRVFVQPLRISGADASPCTVIAEVL